MIPYKDDNPTRTTPFFTIAIIVLNIVIFLYQRFLSPSGLEKLVYSYGAIPYYLIHSEWVQPVHPVLTIFSAMFMHGGFFHLAGNMLYLWIFGNNIEDILGHVRFVIFYILCGVVSSYAHVITEPHSLIPMVGASGAISGILGAYLLVFPKAGVYTVIFFGFFVQIVKIPALIVIGFWAIIQLLNGLISTRFAGEGGVAWFAHIGGFLAGLVMIRLWRWRRSRR